MITPQDVDTIAIRMMHSFYWVYFLIATLVFVIGAVNQFKFFTFDKCFNIFTTCITTVNIIYLLVYAIYWALAHVTIS